MSVHPLMVLKPVVEAWAGQLRRSKDAKRKFEERGQQVEQFYSAGSGFMWNGNYLERFMGSTTGLTPPKFKVTINKSFEFVALMGPMLFWHMARRKVMPHRSMQLDPMVLAGDNQLMQEFFMQMAGKQASEDARNAVRAQVLEHMLNYFPNEQPFGGLGAATRCAVFESLIKGCGFLTTQHYTYPRSDRTLVGSFYTSCDDVFVDPDCRDPLWSNASWIAIRHNNKFFDVEKHFNLAPGTLRKYGTRASYGSAWGAGRTDLPPNRTEDPTRDMIEWYEIYSRAGCGNRMCGTTQVIEPEFDEAVGDFARICICKNCPFPLNLPPEDLMNADDDVLRQQFAWPTEYWRDNEYPVTKLDYYQHGTTSPWPEPPLSPAIGELTVLNILISAYVQTVYDNRQQIIGVMKGAVENLLDITNSTRSPVVVELIPNVKETVSELIQFMNRPEINQDVPKSIQFLMQLVEKRTGLSDALYGGGGDSGSANPRSATEYSGRMQTVNLRPEYMQKCVADFQSKVAEKEVLCAYTHVQADDIAECLGPIGMAAWEELVTNEEPEAVLRGSKCEVHASEMARPNKAHDAQQLQQLTQYLIPVLAGHAATANDPQPLNAFLNAIGDATEVDTQSFNLPVQEPNQEIEQYNQAMQQAQLQKEQAEAAKLSAEAQNISQQGQIKMQELVLKSQDSQTKQAMAQQQAAMKAQESQGKMAMAEHGAMIKQQIAEHGMSMKAADAMLKARAAEHNQMLKTADTQSRIEASQQQQAINAAAAEQKMETDVSLAEIKAALDQQKIQQEGEKHSQSLQQLHDKARQDLIFRMMQNNQNMSHIDMLHSQQIEHKDDSAHQQAEHQNLLTLNKMMMSKAMYDQSKTRRAEDRSA